MSYTKENHIVIIDWTPKTKHAMEEALQADDKIEIVLIDDLEKTPFDHPRVHYIQGYCSNDETLLKANIHKAQAVIIFADKSTNNTELIDGKSLLVATAIERFGKKMGKEIHITAEIVDENHKQNFVNVGVEEFLLGNETIARLAIRSAFSKGISTIYNKLISNEGEDLYEVPNQNWKIYREAFIALLEEGATLISSDGNLDIAERLNETIPPNAKLRVVCKDETYNRLKNKFNF